MDFSKEVLQIVGDIFKIPNKRNSKLRILYPDRLSFRLVGVIKHSYEGTYCL